MYKKARCDEQRAFFFFPLFLRETTAWMQEVEQRRERLPRARVRGVHGIASGDARTALMPLAARRRTTLLCSRKEE
jgi:hypothetical protein